MVGDEQGHASRCAEGDPEHDDHEKAVAKAELAPDASVPANPERESCAPRMSRKAITKGAAASILVDPYETATGGSMVTLKSASSSPTIFWIARRRASGARLRRTGGKTEGHRNVIPTWKSRSTSAIRVSCR